MRTLSNIFGFKSKERQRYYGAEGSICLEFASADIKPELPALRQMILEIDAQFPWRATNGLGEEQESIRYLDDGTVVVHNFHTPIKMCWFRIMPTFKMQKGQLHAYEKYLDKIAEELSVRQIKGLKGTHAIMRTCSSGQKFGAINEQGGAA